MKSNRFSKEAAQFREMCRQIGKSDFKIQKRIRSVYTHCLQRHFGNSKTFHVKKLRNVLMLCNISKKVLKNYCKRAYGLGSQCRPNECLFGSGKPQGVGISGRGPDGRVREIQGSVYEQPKEEADGSCHSKEGSK